MNKIRAYLNLTTKLKLLQYRTKYFEGMMLMAEGLLGRKAAPGVLMRLLFSNK